MHSHIDLGAAFRLMASSHLFYTFKYHFDGFGVSEKFEVIFNGVTDLLMVKINLKKNA